MRQHGRRSLRRRVPSVLCLIGALAATACAASRPGSRPLGRLPGEPSESLATTLEKTRALSANAKPPSRPAARTLEASSRELAAALAALAAGPTAETHRQVAVEYRRLGVLDQAHEHFTTATMLDPHDAASFDALARIWRDWGFARLGIPDAVRALRLVPQSAAAANTMGTLVQAIGQIEPARRWYERALALEPDAAYALNNICYSAILMRDPAALPACRRAAAAVPTSTIARNNLAVAYAARGDLASARQLFEQSGNAALAHYNLGVLYMGRREYRDALQAFGAALEADPTWDLAAARARQARMAAAAEEAPLGHN